MATQKSRFPLFFLLFILIGIYCFVFGESGWLERMRLLKDKDQLINRINILKEENEGLIKLLKRYESGDLSKEESVIAGYVDNNEKLLFFKGGEEYKQISNEIKDQSEKYPADMEHLRILWVVISVMIVLFYYSRRNK